MFKTIGVRLMMALISRGDTGDVSPERSIYLASSVYLALSYPHYYLFVSEIRRWYIRVPTYALLLGLMFEVPLASPDH